MYLCMVTLIGVARIPTGGLRLTLLSQELTYADSEILFHCTFSVVGKLSLHILYTDQYTPYTTEKKLGIPRPPPIAAP